MYPMQYGLLEDFKSSEREAMSTGKVIESSTYHIVLSVLGNQSRKSTLRDSDNESNTTHSNVNNAQ